MIQKKRRKRLDLDEEILNLIHLEKQRLMNAQKIKISDKSALKNLLGVPGPKRRRNKKNVK